MKKSLMMLAAVLCCTTIVMAEPVSPNAARQVAAKFLQSQGAILKSEAMRAPHDTKDETKQDSTASDTLPVGGQKDTDHPNTTQIPPKHHPNTTQVPHKFHS